VSIPPEVRGLHIAHLHVRIQLRIFLLHNVQNFLPGDFVEGAGEIECPQRERIVANVNLNHRTDQVDRNFRTTAYPYPLLHWDIRIIPRANVHRGSVFDNRVTEFRGKASERLTDSKRPNTPNIIRERRQRRSYKPRNQELRQVTMEGAIHKRSELREESSSSLLRGGAEHIFQAEWTQTRAAGRGSTVKL
jgi:hypothetical protein